MLQRMRELPRPPEDLADGDWAPLTPRLVPILSALRPQALSAELWMEVQDAVDGHAPSREGQAWMVDLLDDLLAGRTSGAWQPLPEGYPDGDNGLVNILLDLEAEAIGYDDQGEDAVWTLKPFGVQLQIVREGARKFRLQPWKRTG